MAVDLRIVAVMLGLVRSLDLEEYAELVFKDLELPRLHGEVILLSYHLLVATLAAVVKAFELEFFGFDHIVEVQGVLLKFRQELAGRHRCIHLENGSIVEEFQVLVRHDIVDWAVLRIFGEAVAHVVVLPDVHSVEADQRANLDHVAPVLKLVEERGAATQAEVGVPELVLADLLHDALHEALVLEHLVPFAAHLTTRK
eukprot:CAMPEP_0170494738 /NCGR_PEP_ID=MMETSP0208-20121228/14810_1 /TAXON_ID=197538 /ORGANISM="Strombidium inclinatum, Strain S3" /LENGTH=198 /DNA_ID=CAMNT_0010770831 /DNA_START=369 /DNA_END=965 /DNA_ORIENTATION=-